MPADQAGQRRLLSRCQGLGPNHFSAQYGLLKQSALAGHELSIGFFLAGELFRQETTTHLDFVDDFRAEAPRMFESALQRGSMSAAALGGLADSGAPMAFLPEAVRRNPVERQAAALLSMTAMVTQGRGPSSDAIDKMWQRARRNTTLTPEEFATAERLATERAQAWFSDSTASRAIEEASAMGAVSGRSPMDPNRLCTRGYGHPLSEQPPVKWLP